MAGKAGQRSNKATSVPVRYAQDYLQGMDRRCRAAKHARDLFNRLCEECGGPEKLGLMELESLRRLAHLTRRIRLTEEKELRGEQIEDVALTDSTRIWMGLLKEFRRIKSKSMGAIDPTDQLFDDEYRSEGEGA